MKRYVVYDFMRDEDGDTHISIGKNVYLNLLSAYKELKTKRDSYADEIEEITGDNFKEQTEYVIDYDSYDGLSFNKEGTLYMVDISIHTMEDKE
jgi:hypothetical protein